MRRRGRAAKAVLGAGGAWTRHRGVARGSRSPRCCHVASGMLPSRANSCQQPNPSHRGLVNVDHIARSAADRPHPPSPTPAAGSTPTHRTRRPRRTTAAGPPPRPVGARRRLPRPADARPPGHTQRPCAAASARRRPPEASRRRRRAWRHAIGRLERGRGNANDSSWLAIAPRLPQVPPGRDRLAVERLGLGDGPAPSEHVGEVTSRDELEAPVAKVVVRRDRLRVPPPRLAQAVGDPLHLTLPGLPGNWRNTMNCHEEGLAGDSVGLSRQPAPRRPQEMLHAGLDLSRKRVDVHAKATRCRPPCDVPADDGAWGRLGAGVHDRVRDRRHRPIRDSQETRGVHRVVPARPPVG